MAESLMTKVWEPQEVRIVLNETQVAALLEKLGPMPDWADVCSNMEH